MPWDPGDFERGRPNQGWPATDPPFDPKKAGRLALALTLGVAIIGLIYTSGYTVAPEEEGVVLRFGSYHTTVQPGFHFKLPFGVDVVHRVATRTRRTQEFGFRERTGGGRGAPSVDEESLILTGDLNIADVKWVVQFEVANPQEWLFNIRDPEQTLRDMSESIMRSVIGDRTVDEVLTVGRNEIEAMVLESLQKKMDDYKTGIRVNSVALQDVTPPGPVQEAFNDVNKALQDKETLTNQARQEYNKEIPRAQGQARSRIGEAEGYLTKRVNDALGDVARFTQIYAQYLEAPDVTRRRLYLETMSRVLPRMEEILLVDPQQQGVLPFLDVSGKGGPPPLQKGASVRGGAR